MKCRICGKEINADEKFCKYCGEPNENFQNSTNSETNSYNEIFGHPDNTSDIDYTMQHDNNVAMTLGVIGLSLSVIGFFIFSILEFVALGLSIGGLVVASRNKRNGYPYNGAFVVSLIGVILSSIVCLIVILALFVLISLL